MSSLLFTNFFKKKDKNKHKAPTDLLIDPQEEPHSGSKKLTSGDYFGEVAFIFKCKRTSTIKSKLYATLGCIYHPAMIELLRDCPSFKQHLKRDIVKLYDDDLKLFLVTVLRTIDYLQDEDEEILVNLAYVCSAEIKCEGAMLFDMDEDPD